MTIKGDRGLCNLFFRMAIHIMAALHRVEVDVAVRVTRGLTCVAIDEIRL